MTKTSEKGLWSWLFWLSKSTARPSINSHQKGGFSVREGLLIINLIYIFSNRVMPMTVMSLFSMAYQGPKGATVMTARAWQGVGQGPPKGKHKGKG